MARARAALRDTRAAIDDLRARNRHVRLSEHLDGVVRRFRAESEVAFEFVVNRGVWDVALPAAHQEQLERLLALGCDLSQGYFIARPAAPVVLAADVAQPS